MKIGDIVRIRDAYRDEYQTLSLLDLIVVSLEEEFIGVSCVTGTLYSRHVIESHKLRPIQESAEYKAQESSTGSLRYNTGKVPMHLVPTDAITAMAKVLDYGAKKYAERNWEKNNNLSVPYACLMRHLIAFWEGEDLDPESGLPHTYHVLMNAAMLVRYETQGKEFDDRPNTPKDDK